MDISRPLQNLMGQNTARVLRRLSLVSDELTGRRIAELAEVPAMSAGRVLADLTEMGLVHARDVGRARVYRLNRDHVLWNPLDDMLKAPAIIERQIAEIVGESAAAGATVAVFGSFARGEAGAKSDVDIVIVSRDDAHQDRRFELVDALRERIQLLTGNGIDVIDILDEDLARLVKADDALVESWLQDARTVSGPDLTARMTLLDV